MLAPGTKTAKMVYLANMFKELIGDPVLNTSHYTLGVLHSVRRNQAFFNGNLLMRDVFRYNIYDKITKVLGEIIIILLISALQAPEVDEDSSVETSGTTLHY